MERILPKNTTHLDDWIEAFYHQINIKNPSELDLLDIAYRSNLKVEFLNISSRYYAGTIIIDNRLSPQEQWQDFGHELCHALRHEGNQLIMPPLFRELQEMQAKRFAYKFCIPTFMLRHLKININNPLYEISSAFNVTYMFAKKRIGLVNLII
ncbi:ImmA/IrrE family metallo-endopeptidase [Bacillus altitudinis]|uniref:ImmA/IrrE family metallo-endopeptidase n=1 Tax=Bacillus altitudinis TaxID=293387 RepID=UPI00234D6171|nr:ImmA/IrrE family metallo-endopeptidase [Bacillus altitudinis]MDC7795047.1 ImmA/IrrE family metallo-endopeptidase [Bacillus altitudinis]WOQ71381.1 ImmA/IrrE family metallo-endopeptidase [Bacillus stratosphericus]